MAKPKRVKLDEAALQKRYLISIGQGWYLFHVMEPPPDEDWEAAYALLPRHLGITATFYMNVTPDRIGRAWKSALADLESERKRG
jgi:hypothetical protein